MLKIRQIFLGPHNICALRSAGSHRPNYPRETPLPSYSNDKSSTPTTPPPPLIHAHRRRRPTLLLPPPHPATAPRPRPPSLIRPPNADSGALLSQAIPEPLLPRLLRRDSGGDVWSLTRHNRQDLSPPHPMCKSRLCRPFSWRVPQIQRPPHAAPTRTAETLSGTPHVVGTLDLRHRALRVPIEPRHHAVTSSQCAALSRFRRAPTSPSSQCVRGCGDGGDRVQGHAALGFAQVPP
jgi:hypothetical protein